MKITLADCASCVLQGATYLNKNRTFETSTIEVEPKCDFGSKEEEYLAKRVVVGALLDLKQMTLI